MSSTKTFTKMLFLKQNNMADKRITCASRKLVLQLYYLQWTRKRRDSVFWKAVACNAWFTTMKRISLLRWVLWFNINKLNLINSPNEVSKHAFVPQYFCPETGDLGEVSVDFDFSKAKSVINTIDNTRKTNVATANIMIQQTGLPRRLLLNSTVSSSNRFILLWIFW